MANNRVLTVADEQGSLLAYAWALAEEQGVGAAAQPKTFRRVSFFSFSFLSLCCSQM